jgi:uridine kinase
MDRNGGLRSVKKGSPDPVAVVVLAARVRDFVRNWSSRDVPVVGLSGIDGSGKSSVAAAVAKQLESIGLRVAQVPLDPWHSTRAERFQGPDPAEHFYRHAFRWDDVFDLLIEPLRNTRSVDFKTWVHPIEDAPSFQRRYHFRDVDLVLLEGIFLLKREHRDRLDLGWWIDCPFDEALARARNRNQEGLADVELVREYREIYFPAQRLHLDLDQPMKWAEGVLNNAG